MAVETIMQAGTFRGIVVRPQRGYLLALLLIGLTLLFGCAQQGAVGNSASNPYAAAPSQGPSYAPTHYYPPPGPPQDPWGPYITEAASRFQIPPQWIRAVMEQESGGEEQAVSPVGAMGLMQIMPETYQDLQSEYGLGDDPFDPHNNILAGAAYIREMYDRFGSPGFLAGYNAGPDDVDSYLAGSSPLPDETVNYLAMVTPNLGGEIPFTGAFANYSPGGAAAQATPTLADFASGCDVNAAYDPDHPCSANASSGVIQGQPVIVATTSDGTCDADNAYDPDDPCTPAAHGSASAGSCDADTAYDPDSPCTPTQEEATASVETSTAPVCGSGKAFNPACPATVIAAVQSALPPAPTSPPSSAFASYRPSQSGSDSSNWAIQVGAFTNANLAQSMAQNARNELSDLLGNAAISLLPTTPFGGYVLYQARLTHLSAQAAVDACSALNQRQLPCVVVQPSRV